MCALALSFLVNLLTKKGCHWTMLSISRFAMLWRRQSRLSRFAAQRTKKCLLIRQHFVRYSFSKDGNAIKRRWLVFEPISHNSCTDFAIDQTGALRCRQIAQRRDRRRVPRRQRTPVGRCNVTSAYHSFFVTKYQFYDYEHDYELTLKSAMRCVEARRVGARPNDGFLRQV
jgi:hypothetical protein